MVSKRVLDVGQCDHDHGLLTRLVRQFPVTLDRAHSRADAVRMAKETAYDLVLVNRQLDCDSSSGLAVIQELRGLPEGVRPACMLVSNFADAQRSAVAAGALEGFGKDHLESDETRAKLAAILG